MVDPTTDRSYLLVRRDCNSGRASGGVELIVSHDHPSSIIPLHRNLQAVAVRIAVPRLVTVCSLYLPPNATIDRHDLDRLVTELPIPFIIIGDFNGHNPIWGSKNVNSRGRQIEEFISEHSLCLLNNGEHTHFHLGSRSFHCLDLAVCSASLAPFLTFRVGNDLCESDHFPIFLTRVNVPRVIPQRPERYIFHKADWASFITRAKLTWDMVQYPDLNIVIDNVTASILRAADETIPKSSTKFPKLRKSWWNRQCTETRKNQQIAWNKSRRHPAVANLFAFQRAKSIARRTRRQAQRESWIKLISNINSSISLTDMWNLVKKACGIYPDYPLSYLRKDGQEIHDSKEMADFLAKAFASVCGTQNYAEPFLSYKNRDERIPLRFRWRIA
ncbi:hypothetical protein AVEN_64609-1 [Araneus ventricosus]|uniref:Endonuclease/exonuclease/phosphatase domain-containing protein n=1 Tax=Araneus ventricosus TaxID=182803 RepID=A0A4Y2KI90_ARAVE|nr:hypothetical protein AVEN_64609-1 [Araneus ventricosus]